MHSKLRDFCKSIAKCDFLKKSVLVPDTRFSHFDIVSKVAVIEVEGFDTGLRFDDIKPVFEANDNFSATSAAGKRIKQAMEFLRKAFPDSSPLLKNRTVVQSVVNLACRFVEAGRHHGKERQFAEFVRSFLSELGKQVELGGAATDLDFVRFQKSVNANVKSGARTRHEVLLRKAFVDSGLATAFNTSVLTQCGLPARVKEIATSITNSIVRINSVYEATHGCDLFKTTNRTTKALPEIGEPILGLDDYTRLITNLYFLFRESCGTRMGEDVPLSFADVNTLRTDLQHDTDHGHAGKVRAKKTKAGSVFMKYSGAATPHVLPAELFLLVQSNLLSAIDRDLQVFVVK